MAERGEEWVVEGRNDAPDVRKIALIPTVCAVSLNLAVQSNFIRGASYFVNLRMICVFIFS